MDDATTAVISAPHVIREPKLDAEAVLAIRNADRRITHLELAAKYGVTAQYVGQIRRGKAQPRVARLADPEVERRLEELVGNGGLTAKRTLAVELLFDAILLELDDIKRAENPADRGRRLSVCARSLRDATECAAQLRKHDPLHEMSDKEVTDALRQASS